MGSGFVGFGEGRSPIELGEVCLGDDAGGEAVHRIPLEHVAEGYHIFSAKLDGCIKPLLVPNAA